MLSRHSLWIIPLQILPMISDVSRDDKDNLQVLAPGLDVQSLRRRLKSHKKALNAIEQYRNTKAAHWDIETSAQQKPILLGDSKRMLEELQDIFNEISRAHSRQVWSFKTSQHGNATALLNALKKTP